MAKNCLNCGVYLRHHLRGDKRCRPCNDKFRTIPTEKRFWRFVKKSESCWDWTGSKTHGYGQMSHKRGHSPEKAHKLSWKIHKGEIKNGLWVLHKCGNRSCVRPDHLYLGTSLDNSRDTQNMGRQVIGEKVPSHKLTSTDVKRIRDIFSKSNKSKKDRDELSELFKTARSNIDSILRRHTWKHIT